METVEKTESVYVKAMKILDKNENFFLLFSLCLFSKGNISFHISQKLCVVYSSKGHLFFFFFVTALSLVGGRNDIVKLVSFMGLYDKYTSCYHLFGCRFVKRIHYYRCLQVSVGF